MLLLDKIIIKVNIIIFNLNIRSNKIYFTLKHYKTHKPTIFLRTLYKPIKNKIRNIIKNTRDLEFLNKFLKGVKITKINPNRLLIKNRG